MNDFTVDQFMSILPGPIEKSEHMTQLAEVAAKALKLYGDFSNSANLYSRIDELPEEVLDILAKDLKVDWYDYDYNLETKRRVIRNSWYIHKRLGSARSVEVALSDMWPNSSVEEWFEYGGSPYFFRAILEADDPTNPIYTHSCYDKVRIFKPARSHLEDNEVIVRVAYGIVIEAGTFGHKYHVPGTGTQPRWATHGKKGTANIIVKSSEFDTSYHPPLTGQMKTGLHPNVATHGNKGNGGLAVDSGTGNAAYTARPCGTSLNSLM